MGPDSDSRGHFKPQNATLISQPHAAATDLQKFASISRPATQPASPKHPSITASTTKLLSPRTAWETLSPHRHAASSALGDPCSPPALPASSEHQKNSLDARSLHVTMQWTDRNRFFTRHSSPTQREVLLQIRGRFGGCEFMSLWI